MTLPTGLGFWLPRTDSEKSFSDALAPVKTTDLIQREFYSQAKVGALTEGWVVAIESRETDIPFSDALAPSKTTALIQREVYSRAKTAAFTEAWVVSTASREVSKTFTDALAPSKTTNTVDTTSPRNVVATQDEADCPTVNVDLTWDNDDSSNTLTVQAYYSGGWNTLTSSLAAGSTAYEDAGANINTTKYRVQLNGVSGAPWVESNAVSLLCPE